MLKDFKEYTIFDAVLAQVVTSSTDATPIVVTKATHGYATGDIVVISGHTTNVAANGTFRITVLSSSTFSLQDPYTGANIAGSGGGAGSSGIMMKGSKILLTSDFSIMEFSFITSGSYNGTIKVAGSLGKNNGDAPNFGATVSAANPYTFVQILNLDTAAAVNGATGVTSAGTDVANTYRVNVAGLKYLSFVPTGWTAGTVTIKAMLFNNQ